MAVSNATAPIKPWQHKASKLWCIKRRGKRYYLGRTPEQAIERYLKFRKRIELGLKIPEIDRDSEMDDLMTVKQLCNRFLTHQESRVRSKELSQRSFNDYLATCKAFCEHIGELSLVEELRSADFLSYRESVLKRKNIVGTGNEVTRVKTVFKWGFENDVLATPVKFGASFCRPSKKAIREHRYRQGAKLLTPEEIWLLTDEMGLHYRAMVLLGINCGFGNSDCNQLLIEEVNFNDGLVCGLRPKTAVLRYATLWPITIDALKLSWSRRAKPAKNTLKDRFFLRSDGSELIPGDTEKNIVTKRTTATMQRLKIHEQGKSFYWLRHTFRTIADQIGDDVAIGWVMGHVDDRTAKNYIHDAPHGRIQKVTDHVWNWLEGAK